MPFAGATGFPVRYKLVGFTASLAALTYLDRVCISVLAPDITKAFRLTQVQMSYVFSAFTLAYAIFEIPTAWWADRIGSRAVVTRIVMWWSAFTILTATAFSYTSMLVLQVSFRRGRSGRMAQRRTCFFAMDTGAGTGHRAGRLLCGRASFGGPDAGRGDLDGHISFVARNFRRVRRDRILLGDRLVSLVSRRTSGSSFC